MRTVLIILLALSTLPASAELDRLLSYQLMGDGGAYVSSGFHDWRTVSKYRSRPGLHAGYDIAMLAGSPVRAAWPGTVVALTPWYGSEWGVTVRDNQGYEATYGHISPTVSVGEVVQPGSILGTVVVDHVDVKVRNNKGVHVDFATLEFDIQNPTPQKFRPDQEDFERRRKSLEIELSEITKAYSLGLVPKKKVEQLTQELKALLPEGESVASDVKSAEQTRLDQEVTRPVTESLLNATHAPDF